MDAKATAIATFFLLLVDLGWISAAKPMYAQMVSTVQGKAMRVDIRAVVVAYMLVIGAIVWVVFPRIQKTTTHLRAMGHGATVGLVIYGIFNATNMAMFSEYRLAPALIDTLWGTLLFAACAWVYRAFL